MTRTNFIELKVIFKLLHGPKGCLWDKKQTYLSLIPHLREETRELIKAAQANDVCGMREEIGDVLLNVMFYAQIASKEGKFDIEDVIDSLIKKLKRRHPHVFGKVKVKSSRHIIMNWNKIKKQEKKAKNT